MYDGDLPKMVVFQRFFVCLPEGIPPRIVPLNRNMIINIHKPLDFEVPSETNPYISENLSNKPCDSPANAERTDRRMLA